MKHIVTGSVVALLATATLAVTQPPPTAAKPAADIGATHSVRYPSGNIVTVNWHADESTSTQKLLGANIVAFGGTIPKPPPTGTFAQNVEAAYQAVAGPEDEKAAWASYFGTIYTEVGKMTTAGGFGSPTTDTSRADAFITQAYDTAPAAVNAAWRPFKASISTLLNDKGDQATVIGGLLEQVGKVLTGHAPKGLLAAQTVGKVLGCLAGMEASTAQPITPADLTLWIQLFRLLLPLLIELINAFNAVASAAVQLLWILA